MFTLGFSRHICTSSESLQLHCSLTASLDGYRYRYRYPDAIAIYRYRYPGYPESRRNYLLNGTVMR